MDRNELAQVRMCVERGTNDPPHFSEVSIHFFFKNGVLIRTETTRTESSLGPNVARDTQGE